jgi:uncharacterized protein YejL (UPF0352 family)
MENKNDGMRGTTGDPLRDSVLRVLSPTELFGRTFLKMILDAQTAELDEKTISDPDSATPEAIAATQKKAEQMFNILSEVMAVFEKHNLSTAMVILITRDIVLNVATNVVTAFTSEALSNVLKHIDKTDSSKN